jgi:transposase
MVHAVVCRKGGGQPWSILASTRTKILIESSTESEWVARCLEELGHEVVVADPNFAAMYATRSRKVKTDRRDARTLAEACRLGAYRPAHRASDRQRQVRAQLAVREALVRTRTKYISLVGALLRSEGYRIKSGNAECAASQKTLQAAFRHVAACIREPSARRDPSSVGRTSPCARGARKATKTPAPRQGACS